ncbi:MAG TPA: acyl-CoA thioester hydrolase/BAAT C-terminal domain-containing protein, partial [Acidobacteriota bacterium]
ILHSVGRNDHQQASTILWEYLASYGYIVITVPQVGAGILNPRLAFAAEDVELQKQDLLFALSEVFESPNVDRKKIGFVGHSGGPVAGLLIAQSNPNIDALVSLDGAITEAEGREVMQAAGFDPLRIRTPILNIYRANETHDLSFVIDLLKYSDRYNIAVNPKITHFDFANWPLYSIFSDTEDPRGKPYRSAETAKEFHTAVCMLIRHFFDGMLKGQSVSLQYVKGDFSVKKLDPEILNFSFQSKIDAPDAESLAWMILSGSEAEARLLHTAARMKYPNESIIDETRFNQLAAELLRLEKVDNALILSELNVEDHPGSVKARWLFAESLLKSGRSELASAEYKRVIELSNKTENASNEEIVKIRQAAEERIKTQPQ